MKRRADWGGLFCRRFGFNFPDGVMRAGDDRRHNMASVTSKIWPKKKCR
ncbi:hypothetical protein KCP70_00895 [Salmonella enterica subsp. enterica]|nr:hypothetical protein KCP70_00895 [Salmonella enterica subsp. enterica]